MNQMKKEELEITISDSDRIECAIRHIESSLDVDPWAMEIAVDAMRKQIPTPIVIENGFVKCTECGKYIRFPIIDKYNNCPNCGQAIDWGCE